MGLFSNNKKLCPICGNPTPRIFSTKVEGTPICKECDKKADQLPLGTTDTMTLDQFKAYLDFYEANQPLRQLFEETERVEFNSFSGDLILDQEHGLFRLKNDENALVFEMKDLISFQVLEDSRPLFISEGKNLRTFQSDVPEKANAMAPQIGQFVLMRQQFENMENMARMLEKQGGDQKQDRYDSSNRPERPYFDVPAPFESFFVDLKLNHPYWRSFRGEITAPSFDRDYPSLDSYLKSYQKKADNLHAFARDFIHMMNPGAQEIYDGVETARPQAVPQVTPQSVPQAAPAQASDPIQEIQKYKQLFDAGVITEAEFTAKKKQLMGI